MPDIKDSVGTGGTNRLHDVALLQVMLKVIKDAKGTAYLGGNYDGKVGPDTNGAILRFQKDQKLLPLPAGAAAPKAGPGGVPPAGAAAPGVAAEKAGLVAKGSATLKRLNELLPADYKDARVLENTNLVYLPGAEADAKANSTTILSKIDLDPTFRQKVAATVTQMYKDHGIVLSIPKSGWRRDFAWQLEMHLKGVGSHPGESNHQYGRGVDLGMNRLEWVAGDGTIAHTDYWLNADPDTDPKMSQHKRDALWTARNEIAYKAQGLSPTSRADDDVHVQAYDDAGVDYPVSLAKLLSLVGEAKWSALPNVHKYKTDFGLGGAYFWVGTATDNWQGKANVTASDLVTALKAFGKDLAKLPVFKEFQYVKNALKAAAVAAAKGAAKGPVVVDSKGIKVSDIVATDVAAVKLRLKADWVAADLNWQKWVK
jgi:hypothetical protein